MYGPVRTVVWEGKGREAPPYPDQRDVMEYRPDSGSDSLRLDVERPDNVAPLLRFVGDELAKVGGTATR